MWRRGLLVFALLSLVSLLADATYEGARSVLGPLTRLLGAPVIAAGVLAVGEIVAHLARGLGGFLASRASSPRGLWAVVWAGYILNLVAVPLLAYAGHYYEALALVMLERLGKGLRSPARDVILGEVSQGIGTHRAYAIHELADQAGAVLGPLMVALVASARGDLRAALLALALPAAGSLLALLGASLLYPEPREVSYRRRRVAGGWDKLAAAIGLSAAALPLWPVLSYRAPPEEAALAYGLAMAVDAAAALAAGELGERRGPLVAALPLLALASGMAMALWPLEGGMLLAAAVLWGAYMGFFEVYSRSVVVWLVPPGRRARVYGLIGLYTAVALTLSGLVYGGLAWLGMQWLSPLAALVLALPSLMAVRGYTRPWSSTSSSWDSS